MTFEPPNLAVVKSKSEYRPTYGDLLFDVRLFTTLFGFVIDYTGEEIEVYSSGSLRLLLDGNERHCRKIKYETDHVVYSNRFTIIQSRNGNNVWYI